VIEILHICKCLTNSYYVFYSIPMAVSQSWT